MQEYIFPPGKSGFLLAIRGLSSSSGQAGTAKKAASPEIRRNE
jgi:hypothetical protein